MVKSEKMVIQILVMAAVRSVILNIDMFVLEDLYQEWILV